MTEAALDLCHGDSQTSYKKHARCVERTIHSNGHGGIGGTMSRISAAPVDPLFYIHHAFVDWQWARWQEESPSRRKTTSKSEVPMFNLYYFSFISSFRPCRPDARREEGASKWKCEQCRDLISPD